MSVRNVVGSPPGDRPQRGGHASQVADLRFGEGGGCCLGDESVGFGVGEDAGSREEGEGVY